MLTRNHEVPRVFISYSHKDKKWLEELRRHLKALPQESIVDYWDDTRIQAGQKWDKEIREVLRSACVAVLLVSADFLASDYIRTVELPLLREMETVTVLPVIVSPCWFKQTEQLAELQAANDYERPLVDMTKGERERLWVRLTEQIETALSSPPGIEPCGALGEPRGEPQGTTLPATSRPEVPNIANDGPAGNPFFWRYGITDASAFFDRDDEQQMLRSYLLGRQNCQIVGPRRIGKTSLLRQLVRKSPTWMDEPVVAYLDLQDPHCFTLSGWLNSVSQQMRWPKSPANLIALTEGIEAMLGEGRHPVLCLDEIEELTQAPRSAEFDHDFYSALRSCAQRGMSIITTSQKQLSELTDPGDATSSFFNIFPQVRLGPFADADAEDFVNCPRAGASPFTRQEKRNILEFAKGHPLALQVVCFHVLHAKQNRGSMAIALQRAAVDMKGHLP